MREVVIRTKQMSMKMFLILTDEIGLRVISLTLLCEMWGWFWFMSVSHALVVALLLSVVLFGDSLYNFLTWPHSQ